MSYKRRAKTKWTRNIKEFFKLKLKDDNSNIKAYESIKFIGKSKYTEYYIIIKVMSKSLLL